MITLILKIMEIKIITRIVIIVIKTVIITKQ